ncbi:MAG TPA: hypothetical protein VLQ78_11425 [Ornithinibacter sp.]|nr:hypothetical protein [Ornithinibacter sp.]
MRCSSASWTVPEVAPGRPGPLADFGYLSRAPRAASISTRAAWALGVAPTISTASGDPAPGATGAALAELSAVLADPAPWPP